LSDNDLAFRHPLSERAVGKQSVLGQGFKVIEIKLFSFIFEEQFIRIGIELEIIDFGVMVNLTQYCVCLKVEDRNSLKVQQVSDQFGAFIINPCRNKVAFHIFGSTGSQRLVSAIFNQSKLSGIRDHANTWTREIKFLVATSSPVNLALLASLKI
jgi:hypothetical protein